MKLVDILINLVRLKEFVKPIVNAEGTALHASSAVTLYCVRDLAVDCSFEVSLERLLNWIVMFVASIKFRFHLHRIHAQNPVRKLRTAD